jgi:Ca-activated chloride channel family protein
MTKGHKPGRDVLKELADFTGGLAFFSTDSLSLAEACARISEVLKTQYVLGYISTNTAKNGKWRKLNVRVDPAAHFKVHARTGYYAPST